MKFSKLFAGIFGVLGLLLAVGTVLLSLKSLDAAPVLLSKPEAAAQQSEAMMEAVCRGDYTGAGAMMLGGPDLGAGREAADETGRRIWDAFLQSLHYEFTGDCYATDSGVARNVTMEYLDVSSVTGGVKERARVLLEQRVAQAEDVGQIYDESGEYREDFVMEVLEEAVTQALAEDAQLVSREFTMNLIWQDDQWWILPEQELLSAISGGIAG